MTGVAVDELEALRVDTLKTAEIRGAIQAIFGAAERAHHGPPSATTPLRSALGAVFSAAQLGLSVDDDCEISDDLAGFILPVLRKVRDLSTSMIGAVEDVADCRQSALAAVYGVFEVMAYAAQAGLQLWDPPANR